MALASAQLPIARAFCRNLFTKPSFRPATSTFSGAGHLQQFRALVSLTKQRQATQTVYRTNTILRMSTQPMHSHGGPRVPYERYSFNWWKEYIIICTVFAITGSSSLYVVRPTLEHVIGVQGTLREGPWSYRVAYICTTLPAYSIMLVTFGTIAGRGPYFRAVASKMWGRLLPFLK